MREYVFLKSLDEQGTGIFMRCVPLLHKAVSTDPLAERGEFLLDIAPQQ
jgi:hypothetical protein